MLSLIYLSDHPQALAAKAARTRICIDLHASFPFPILQFRLFALIGFQRCLHPFYRHRRMQYLRPATAAVSVLLTRNASYLEAHGGVHIGPYNKLECRSAGGEIEG